ncbi:MAG: T9SS type A sorting domain-containing protein [bacterium]|nr:T9SS type A sorting domain-containing protein [Candidatus Kapabacteria bacterium]
MRLNLLLRPALLMTVLATSLNAQQHTTNATGLMETSIAAAPSCGTQHMMRFDRAKALRNTIANAPEVHRQAVALAKGKGVRMMSADEETFFAPDFVTQMWLQIRAVRVHMGNRARIWVDVRDTGRADVKAKLPILIGSLEDSTAAGSRNPRKGIIENDIDVFGPTPTTVGDDYYDFLLFDITDQQILGFFQPTDQTTDEFSNRRNMLYIDSREGLIKTSSVLNTLAHEFQHLIHYGQNPAAELFINEGASEVAGIMCGYPDRKNTSYLRNTNTSMFSFPSDDNGINQAYERALTFMHYLYEQYGEGFLHSVLRTRMMGMSAINDALATAHPTNALAKWEIAGRGFAVANWLQTSDDQRYAYKVNITSTSQPRAKQLRVYSSSNFRRNDTVTVLPYGAAYLIYENPPVLTLKIKGRYHYRVMAIGYRGDEVEVMDFESGQPAVIGSPQDLTRYDRVVLVITELSNATQKITWDVNEGISAIDDETSAGAATRFVAVTPNPVQSTSEISFVNEGKAGVTLELFSPTGEVVRTLMSNESLPAGTHRVPFDATGLAAGMYLARLSEGDRSATHLVIVR